MIEYEYAPFSEEFVEPYGRLFSLEGYERSPDRTRWTFRTGHGVGALGVARDTEASRQVIGVMALTPTRLKCGDSELEGWHAFDLVVDPAYRGRGVFTGLAKAAFEGLGAKGADLVWGAPNANSAHGFFQKFSWRKIRPVPLMMRPLRTGFLLRRLAPMLGRIDIPLGRRSRKPVPGAAEIESFGPEADRLWEQFSRRIGCSVIRDSKWLNWRLAQRPSTDYRKIASFDAAGEMRAFVATHMAEAHGGNMLHFMEAMSGKPDNDSTLAELIRAELSRGLAEGADAALCWCPPDAPQYRAYRRAGFVPVPTRLRPITFYFGVMPLREVVPEACSSSAWYMSYLDLDTM